MCCLQVLLEEVVKEKLKGSWVTQIHLEKGPQRYVARCMLVKHEFLNKQHNVATCDKQLI